MSKKRSRNRIQTCQLLLAGFVALLVSFNWPATGADVAKGENMTWFEKLMGFAEQSPQQVRQNLEISGNQIKSRVNGRSFAAGILEMPTLNELRQRVKSLKTTKGRLKLREIVGDARQLHADPENANALFQVASQFNLLEMAAPHLTPECGIGIYENDHTQGPSCAVSAGAGTIYRNYFIPLNGQIGQSAENQINCLEELSLALGRTDYCPWRMQNGYALLSAEALKNADVRLTGINEDDLQRLRALLRVGIQWDTEITWKNAGHKVSQAYCSAMPVAYSGLSKKSWEKVARLVLEAAYEATICAGILNAQKKGSRKIFLTMLGGGVFGNDKTWILDAIRRTLALYSDYDLEIVIVSYGSKDKGLQELLNQFAQ